MYQRQEEKSWNSLPQLLHCHCHHEYYALTVAVTFNLSFKTSFRYKRDPTGSTVPMKTENYCCNGIHGKPKKELLLQKHGSPGGRQNMRALSDYFETAWRDLPTSSNVIQAWGPTPCSCWLHRKQCFSAILWPARDHLSNQNNITHDGHCMQCPIQNAAW